MSSRAVRRLREEQEAAAAAAAVAVEHDDNDDSGDDNDEASSEEEDGDDDEMDDEFFDGRRQRGGGFASFLPSDDDEDESSSSSSSSGGCEDVGGDGGGTTGITASSSRDHVDKQKSNEAFKSGRIGKKNNGLKNDGGDAKESDGFDDFDAIIVSLATENATSPSSSADHATASSSISTIRSLLLSEDIGFDVRDLDSDRAMRSLPLGGGIMVAAAVDAMWDDEVNVGVVGARGGGGGDGRRQRQQQRLRRHHKKYVFGMPRPEWGKPPSYVGGGIGTYEEPPLIREDMTSEGRPWSVPWPYNLSYNTTEASDDVGQDKNDGGADGGNNDINQQNKSGRITPHIPPLSKQKWFTLTMSDTYQSDDHEYRTMLTSSLQHDPNLLAMFVADHPFYAEAMLQLAMVLYYVDDRARGNELLRRTLFLYETALPSSVLPNISGSGYSITNDGFEMFIDVERCPTDAGFLASLFRIMQLHGMLGRHECALAMGRYLLSLDPLRDPMDVLVVLDYYALASTRRQRRIHRRRQRPIVMTTVNVDNPTDAEVKVGDNDDDFEENEEEEECGAAFIVELIESKRITIHYIDPSTDRHHFCRLLDMPNFAFSYALALYRLSSDEDGRRGGRWKKEERQRADDALVDALRRFPLVLPKLLAMIGVNTEDRSFRADWPTVLPYFNADASHSANRDTGSSAEDRVARAGGEHVVGIFVKRCHGLWKEDKILCWLYQCAVLVVQDQPQNDRSSSPTHPTIPLVSTFSPALSRYAKCDPSEFEDSFRTFPPEAIALDPNVVIPAMEVGPHGRRRFLRRGRQPQQEAEEEQAFGIDGAGGLRQMLGLGGNGGVAAAVDVLDPDLPLLQLYMQSLLPWSQVEGVRPPAR